MLDMLMGAPPGGGVPLGGPGGGSDPNQAAFASGILAGAGLREISQVLGLSKRRQQRMGASGAMPSSGRMLQGNLGDMDRILLLAKMQGMMGGGPEAVPPMPANPALAGPPPILPMPAGPMPGPGSMPLPGAPPMGGVGPMGPGPIVPPMGGGNPFGGDLPIQLLQQMLGSAGGIV